MRIDSYLFLYIKLITGVHVRYTCFICGQHFLFLILYDAYEKMFTTLNFNFSITATTIFTKTPDAVI